MASFKEIREGLAANVGSISGLQASAYLLGSPTPPVAEVEPGWGTERGISYDKTFQRGLDGYAFTVRVLIGAPSDVGAQKRLDRMLAPSGADSIKAAVESDLTLGGDIETLRVTECSGYRLYRRDGGAPLLGAEWRVEIWAEGTI